MGLTSPEATLTCYPLQSEIQFENRWRERRERAGERGGRVGDSESACAHACVPLGWRGGASPTLCKHTNAGTARTLTNTATGVHKERVSSCADRRQKQYAEPDMAGCGADLSGVGGGADGGRGGGGGVEEELVHHLHVLWNLSQPHSPRLKALGEIIAL